VTFVSKPNSLLRVKLTAEAQWHEITSYVIGPDLSFPQRVSGVVEIKGVVNEMVGDIERIQNYPDSGYQVSHELPERILIEQGLADHLLPGDLSVHRSNIVHTT
jgi:hypothetical protein